MKKVTPLATLLRIALLLTLLLLASFTQMALAQQANNFSERIIVYEETRPDLINNRVSLVADRFGYVHLMWRHVVRAGTVVEGHVGAAFYSRWDGSGWSQPVDVLVSPNNDNFDGARMDVDEMGRLHAVWSGRNTLYYSWAWGDEAHQAGSWLTPVSFPLNSFTQSITTEGEDRLHILYSDAGREVFYFGSQDGGETWSSPVQLSNTEPDGVILTISSAPRLAVGPEGVLHAIWNEASDEDYIARAVFYVQSRDGGSTWSDPAQVFANDVGDPNIIVAGDGSVHAFGNGRGGIGRFHRWSADGGFTWSEIENLAPVTGGASLTGEMDVAVDSNGWLHVIYVTNTPGVMYTYWDGFRFATPTLLASGDESGWWGEGAVLTVAQGNQVHITIPGAFGRIWHSWRELADTPLIPPLPLPIREIEGIPSEELATPNSLDSLNESTNPLPEELTRQPTTLQTNRFSSLLVILLPTFLLLITVIGYSLRRSK